MFPLGLVKCENCCGSHRRASCPFKDMKKSLSTNAAVLEWLRVTEKMDHKKGDSAVGKGAGFSIDILNVSESTTETNLEELVKSFGPLQEFGESAGPNPATTIEAEDLYVQKKEDKGLEKLKVLGDKNVIVKCIDCRGVHWTSRCPLNKALLSRWKVPDDKKGPVVGDGGAKPGGFKYIIPPNMNMARRDHAAAL